MSIILYEYRFFCTTEGKYVSVWGTSPPSPLLCPNNSADTVDASTIHVAQTVSQSQFTALEASTGYYQAMTICMDIPNGTPGYVYTQDVTWPGEILLWTNTLYVDLDAENDIINLISGPNTTIGIVTAGVNIGVTTITVSSTVIANVTRGLNITLFDGVNTDELGKITAIDKVNSIITFATPTTHAFAIGSLVRLNIHTIDNFIICKPMISSYGITYGHKGIKGKTVPPGVIIRVNYTNVSGLAKKIAWKVEYYITN